MLPNGNLLISDSEVEECVGGQLPVYWQGVNLFEADRSGNLLATSTTYTHTPGSCPTAPTGAASNFTSEPTGVAINPTNGHRFFSDDDQFKVFEADSGLNLVRSFSTAAFGDSDPEGIAFARVLGSDNLLHDNLFVVKGGQFGGPGIYQLDPGPNGIFDGVPPAGDDVVTHFDTATLFSATLGISDPEGVTFNPDPLNPGTGTLYIVGADKHMAETTLTGTLLHEIDITGLDSCAPADVVPAPGSTNLAVQHLYIVDRGVDNNDDRFENDGKVYEATLDPVECALLPQNLLLNPGFEIDCNRNTFPDKWTSDSRFTRSNEVVHGGKYAGKHFATDDSTYTIGQTITGLSAGTLYNFSGWVNIPPTTDTFTFELAVTWTKSDGTSSTQSIRTYTAATTGWDQVVTSWVAPPLTTRARVQMVVSSLNATIYVDDFVFSTSAAPTITSFTPSSGPVGTQVTITGSHFTGATAVAFHGVTATFTVDSDTQIRATVLDGATTGPISVTTAAGTGVSASAFTVTGTAPGLPAITSFTPSSGPVGIEVTITGSNFTGATAVTFNGTAAPTRIVDSDVQIHATVPSGATTGLIGVTTPAGTGFSASNFTVTGPPVNLLANPGFELDANGDSLPDNWTPKAQFTRSNEVVHSGSFAGKHFSSKKASYTISQIVNGLTAGTTYNFSGWVNIPLATGTFEFRLEVTWRKANNKAISTTVIKKYTTDTTTAINGWDQATASPAAPAGTVSAEVRMVVKNLTQTVYVDDFAFTP